MNGTLEINQTCVPDGCFIGDSAGFPVEIESPGSYVLTSNLAVPNGDTTAVEASTDAPGATIDLNGFSIQGTGASGDGRGVTTTRPGPEGISVTNGTVQLMAITASSSASAGDGWEGIRALRSSTISNNAASSNERDGIEAGAGSTELGKAVRDNGG